MRPSNVALANEMTKKVKWIATFEAYTMYLMTGAACLMIGTTLPHLMKHFGVDLVAVAALGSIFALGRVTTVFVVGYLTEKFGPKRILGAGFVLLLSFMAGIPSTTSYTAAMVFCFLGGIGMGTQDAACPVVLGEVYPGSHASALSAGQAFFGAGCFLPPMVMSVTLLLNLPFTYTYYVFAVVALGALAVLPLMNLPKSVAVPSVVHEAASAKGGPSGMKGRWLMLLSFAFVCIFYCASTNTVSLYTSSFAVYIGMQEKAAVMLLSIYNIGSMLGSLLFVGILRRAKPVNVLGVNLLIAIGCFLLVLWVRSFPVLAVLYFTAGMFIGVLFSIMVTLAVSLAPDKASRAAAVVAMLSGGADIVSPLVTGAIITATGIMFSLYYILIMLTVTLLSSLLFRKLYSRHRLELRRQD